MVGGVSTDLVLSTVLLVELEGGRVPRGIKFGLPSLFGFFARQFSVFSGLKGLFLFMVDLVKSEIFFWIPPSGAPSRIANWLVFACLKFFG